MGTLISKPRSGDNPPKKIRTRTYSGSSLNKKPTLFKSLSKRKDETSKKSATLQPTRTGDNLQVPMETATEPILAPAASCEVKSSPVAFDSQPPKVADEKVVQESTILKEEAISKAANFISKEEEAKEDTPAKIDKHPTGSEELTVVVDNDAIARKVTDEVIEVSVEEFQKEVMREEMEPPLEDVKESGPQVEGCQGNGEFDGPGHESINEVARDHQESEIAEILVNEALNSEVDVQAVEEKEQDAPESTEGEQLVSNLEEQRAQSSESTSDYVEALQQSQSVSEAFADPNEVTDGTKNIQVACLNDETRDGESKEVPEDVNHEADLQTEEIAHEGEDDNPTNNDVTGDLGEVSHGDDVDTDRNGHLDGNLETGPIASLKASIGEGVEHNDSTTIQE